MLKQNDPRLERLMTAIGTTIEDAINKEGVNIPDVFALLCAVISWLSASLPPEDRTNAESYFAKMIPEALRDGDALRAKFLRHGWGTA
jgi:hypothetical protein